MNTSRPPNTPRTGGSPLVACLACRRPNRGNQEQTSGFTLMEMLLALAVSAIVLAGIGGVFFSAMRLRERTTAMLDEAAPLQQALTILRRDLKGALPPGTGMAGEFRCGNVSSSIGETLGLQFSTTTGVLRDDMPWGDVQEVTYELRTSAVRNGGSGRVLIRTVTRDLLATAGLDYTEQWLLENVESLAFECFDGLQW
ncbi:MAG TPA: prepilin-type N-terminal cleavage/methylation domain-containing protein, partial [Clostridia bacterium]|nr:prepilin-type N-terminal cleavage/methylation domain-containing protein [Clostridia bacterium]